MLLKISLGPCLQLSMPKYLGKRGPQTFLHTELFCTLEVFIAA